MTTRERHRTCDTETGREHLTTVIFVISTYLYYLMCCMKECLLVFFCIYKMNTARYAFCAHAVDVLMHT